MCFCSYKSIVCSIICFEFNVYPWHDVNLHPHGVKEHRLGCVRSDIVLAKALT